MYVKHFFFSSVTENTVIVLLLLILNIVLVVVVVMMFQLVQNALNDSLRVFQYEPSRRYKRDIELCIAHVIPSISQLLLEESQNAFPLQVKFQLQIHVSFKKYQNNEDGEQEVRFVDPYFLTENELYNPGTLDLDFLTRQLVVKYDSFIQLGSGWTLDQILNVGIKLYRVRPLQGGGSDDDDEEDNDGDSDEDDDDHQETGLPPKIAVRKACLTIKNTNRMCFVYACLAGLHPIPSSRQPGRLYHYRRYRNELDLRGLTFPTRLSDINRFEKNNPNLSVNVLGYEESSNTVIPIYRTSNHDPRNSPITLLLHRSHYYLVKSLSRLLQKQRSHQAKVHYCHFCLCHYPTESRLREHQMLCTKKLQRLSVPSTETRIEFKNYKNMFLNPFVIYYDIECIIVRNKLTNKDDHVPISVCSYTKCINDRFSSKAPVVFTGRDCMTLFVRHLDLEEVRICDVLRTVEYDLDMDSSDEEMYDETHRCEICNCIFDPAVRKKCRDHNHLLYNSNFRGAVCNTCNLTHGKTRFHIPVVAHNASNYDLNIVLTHLKNKKKNVSVLAKNRETFLTLHYGRCLHFIDSANFLPGSLDSMVKLLSPEQLKPYLLHITTDENRLKLLHRKGVFPYDYMNNEDRLNETCLPARTEFHNSLTNTSITEAQYELAQNMWVQFGCNTIRDYLEVYLVLDTMLLTGLVEAYRSTTHAHFKLDPTHYVSSASLSMDAMLRVTRVKLETLPTTDMYLFVTKSIRGGLCGTATRYAKSNHDLCSDYDESKDNAHIISWDCNNLYGTSLCSKLPTGDFKWLTPREITTFDITQIPENGTRGYFLEVDLKYPQELHELHNDLPLAPEKLDIPSHEWSEYTQRVSNRLKLKHKTSGLKLMVSLRDKTRYILHHETLRFYMRQGLELKRIRRGISFKQSSFMKSYILLNNRARARSTSPFDNQLYKFYNNAVFGKTLYNVFKQVTIKLTRNERSFQRLAAQPNFQGARTITEDLVSVEMKPSTVVCDKPIFIGATVLDLSKQLMYSFMYDFIIPRYAKCSLLYYDTDSFYLEIKDQPDLYQTILESEHYFDRSTYPKHHFLHSDSRKQQLGIFKDIHAGDVITEVIALRSKMYAVRIQNEQDDKKAKGLKRHLLKDLTVDTYSRCLFECETTRHTYREIRRFKHRLVTQDSSKVGLSPYEDKRYVLPCGIHTLAYGHYRIKDETTPACRHCDG